MGDPKDTGNASARPNGAPRRIGRYEVELALSEGAVSRVYVARDPVLGRRVALKAIRDDLEIAPELLDRFVERIRSETLGMAGLSHPAWTAIHDMGSDEHVKLFVVYQFAEGPSLRERLASGPIPPGDAAQLAKTIGAALAHAHGSDVVHRDVKPESIILSPTGAKLTAAGFASIARADKAIAQALPSLKATHEPEYSAPELANPDRYGRHSDQFALAATIYEALTGKRARSRIDVTAATGRRAFVLPVAPSTALPRLRSFPNIDTIFRRAFAPDPRKRFSSCDVFGNVLATEIEGAESHRLAPISASSIVPRATRRRQNVVAGAALLVIMGLVVLGRQRSANDGVSLKTVAADFAIAIATPRPASSHHPRAAPSAPSSPARVVGVDSAGVEPAPPSGRDFDAPSGDAELP